MPGCEREQNPISFDYQRDRALGLTNASQFTVITLKF